MTAAEAADIAKSKDVGEDILRYIGNKKDWIKSGEVKHNLVFNPKCPVGISLKFLGHMRADELRTLARSRNVSAQIRSSLAQRSCGGDAQGKGLSRDGRTHRSRMSLLGKIFGRRSAAEERQHADELFARGEFGLAKLAYERALGLARGEPEALRAELAARAEECRDATRARAGIAEGDRLLAAGERELALAEFQGAADTAASCRRSPPTRCAGWRASNAATRARRPRWSSRATTSASRPSPAASRTTSTPSTRRTDRSCALRCSRSTTATRADARPVLERMLDRGRRRRATCCSRSAARGC